MPFDLPMFFAFIIAFAILAYVVMDGFDLGIGILFWRLQPGPHRDAAMNSVAPVWDGNETWLVLGGGGLLAAFPLAYAIVLPALYAPLVAMLLALVFRGVAFEFRWRDPGHRRLWDLSFTLGSLTAALAQGVALVRPLLAGELPPDALIHIMALLATTGVAFTIALHLTRRRLLK